MISIDFKKCFDKIEFTAIEGALQYFGFGQNFIQMVKLLYCQFETAVVHNGEITDFMNPTRVTAATSRPYAQVIEAPRCVCFCFAPSIKLSRVVPLAL